jgi:uncharacterized protein (TIRG00374 family)
MEKPSRKLLLISLGVAVLGFLLYRSRDVLHAGDFFRSAADAVRRTNPLLLCLSLVAIYTCYGIRALRWQVLQRNLGRSRFWQIYGMTVAGFASIFLFGRPGEPVRILLLARKEEHPVSDLFGVYVVERILDFASTLVIAALGLFLISSRSSADSGMAKFVPAFQTAGGLLGAAVFAAIALLVFVRWRGAGILERRLAPWLAAGKWKKRLAGTLLGLARGVQTIRTGNDLFLATLYSAAHWFLVLLIYLWVPHAFGGRLAELNLGDAMLLMAFTLVGSIVQLPGIGGGSQVASVLVFTKVFGVEPGLAAAAAIMIWLITFAAVAIVGTPILIHQGLSLGQLKEMAEHERAREASAGDLGVSGELE